MEEPTSGKKRPTSSSSSSANYRGSQQPPLPAKRNSKSVSGFQNPLFADGETTNTVEYAKVNKKRDRAQPPVNDDKAAKTQLQTASLGFYEEIPHDAGNKTDEGPSSKHISAAFDSNRNNIGIKQGSSTGDDGLYSEIDQTDRYQKAAGSRDDTEKKKKLERISSAKGSFHDLKFDTTTDERLTGNGGDTRKVPIYHNSSIPTTPITTLGDPVNRTSSDIYEDAPRSSATDTINNETYQQPLSLQLQQNQMKSDSIYDVPSSPVSPLGSETYDMVPQNRKKTNSVYANYRRPVPGEIDVQRVSYNLLNYSESQREDDVFNHSSPAFYLLLANFYLQNNSNNLEHEIEELLAKVRILMRTAEDMWSGLDDKGVGTSVDEAGFILRKSLRKEDIAFKQGEEKAWDTEQQKGGVSPYAALHPVYTKCIESTKKSCLLFTFERSKTCICLFDGHGNQTFLDYNVHFKSNQQSTEEAIGDAKCGGVVVKCKKQNSDLMLNYILTNMCLEMKADARCGSVVPVHHKNHYLGETSPPVDFI